MTQTNKNLWKTQPWPLISSCILICCQFCIFVSLAYLRSCAYRSQSKFTEQISFQLHSYFKFHISRLHESWSICSQDSRQERESTAPTSRLTAFGASVQSCHHCIQDWDISHRHYVDQWWWYQSNSGEETIVPPTSRLTALGMPSLELGLFSVFVGGGGGWGHAAARNRERLPILGMTWTVAHKPPYAHTHTFSSYTIKQCYNKI